jgi:hypothetical protein
MVTADTDENTSLLAANEARKAYEGQDMEASRYVRNHDIIGPSIDEEQEAWAVWLPGGAIRLYDSGLPSLAQLSPVTAALSRSQITISLLTPTLLSTFFVTIITLASMFNLSCPTINLCTNAIESIMKHEEMLSKAKNNTRRGVVC